MQPVPAQGIGFLRQLQAVAIPRRGAELERDIAERLGMKAEPVAWWLS